LSGVVVLLLIGGAVYYGYRTPQTQKPPVPLPQQAALPLPPPPPEKVSEVQAVPEPAEEPKAPPEQPASTVSVTEHALKEIVNPLSVRGYEAMRAKNLEDARVNYARLLTRDPRNREALLGLAAIAVKRGRSELAERYYRSVLENDPEDPVAAANLIDMEHSPDDESRLKTLLRHSPDSGPLYFSLGNQYAGRSQWADAEQAYFSAYSNQTDNPDYAFNLAVSLDHLDQQELALKYYRMALSLSGKGFPGFDPKVLDTRIKELEK
ncbi:MAG TPA: tetratricopeptide repeat protein, partial [Burkholderiales bacterium]|nr:tetratricopeptide repeat protein [Burkholderiales bacterium]